MGLIYLIHFDQKYKHAGHYLGFVEDEVNGLEKRLKKHVNGTGSRLMKTITEKGITFKVAKTWVGVDRNEERRMKIRGGGTRFCPICKKKH